MKKYTLTKESKQVGGITLYRIKALRNLADVQKGELGGWIEKESNLSQEGYCWVSGNAMVSGKAVIENDARISGNAQINGDVWVGGNVWICGDLSINGNKEESCIVDNLNSKIKESRE